MYEFNVSLQSGQEGELFMRYWLSKQYPGLQWREVEPGGPTDLSGIDLYVTADESVQVKWDKKAVKYGNVFIETISQVERGKPGWANKCAADVLYILCPGLGHVFRIENPIEAFAEWLPGWGKSYGVKNVRNKSWTTRGIPVPIRVFAQHFPPEFDEDLRQYFVRSA